MVRWIVTPVISIEIPAEEGGGVRRYPRLCYKDRYPCVQWGAVFFDESKLALVRFEVTRQGSIDTADFVEELSTPDQWASFYQAHPELKKRWSDQP